ncbi:putative Phage terminase small subunit P27 family [Pseudomonas sp. IT-P74]|jgi:hypothetical protein|uniref:hypothetical protein n=1 Tax=Pseudomonas sp. IT-P74 TaxID=3026445 RepID=UPI0039DFA492
MSERKRRKVDLRIANAGVQLELPLGEDGKLPREWLRFQSLGLLVSMWWRVEAQLREGKAIRPYDAKALHRLMMLLVNDRRGPKLLVAMQEHHRRRLQTDLNLLIALDAFDKAKANEEAPDLSEAEERQFRRQIVLLKKHGVVKRRGERTTTPQGGCP